MLAELALLSVALVFLFAELALLSVALALLLIALTLMLLARGSMSVAPVWTRRAPVLLFFPVAERTAVIVVYATPFGWRFVAARFLSAPPASQSTGLGAAVLPCD